MYKNRTRQWQISLSQRGKYPAYKLIADLIAQDIETGKLSPNDKIPPMRDLAAALHINYSTAARAYTEAKKRGLIETVTGSGTFIRGKLKSMKQPLATYELMMNMVIEPAIPTLVDEIKDVALSSIAMNDFYSLMRYQSYGGNDESIDIMTSLIQRRIPDADRNRVITTQGIHTSITALLTMLCEQNQVLCVDSLSYPGIKTVAAQLGKTLFALDRDKNGPTAISFENACQSHSVAALYLNPTMHNPTCTTIPRSRREALCDIAIRYNIPIIEDDSYGLLSESTVPPLAYYAPELTYYLGGFSKCLGPGLRVGYMLCPSQRKKEQVIGAMHSLNIMGSPLIHKLLSDWISAGTLDRMIQAIRTEAAARRNAVYQILHGYDLRMELNAFHFWLNLPKPFNKTPVEFAEELRQLEISAVASSAFSTDNNPPDALRVCIGGPISRVDMKENMKTLKEKLVLLGYPSTASGYRQQYTR
ncbi:aminotransferase-like domain-containing protein [Vibrio mangrovi]|uniref:PLP-dependent aminotransferase family protein n=1 Tax=Vibrio mangrovi TaxID=474394 RepID=A0A1Y6IY86_9VIBR|nr:PLP-dependent aminotransferase family protein [Vibrio mangrovi]MDW6005155.1 PLP-dependent aminotransferase family protein [Vibrio mangrovi]SMS02635.1 putative HTH-type transcriptional regulator YjiR [Vibrio mangrovi]